MKIYDNGEKGLYIKVDDAREKTAILDVLKKFEENRKRGK